MNGTLTAGGAPAAGGATLMRTRGALLGLGTR